jgi:hypothetical protein
MMSDEQNEESQSYLGYGVGLGVALGAGVGAALGNLALGIGIGTAIGLAFGALGGKRIKVSQQSSDTGGDDRA